MSNFIGLDIGTTSVKAAIFNAAGDCSARCSVDYALETPAIDWVQLDPEHYWRSAQDVLQQVVSRADLPPDSIAAIGISSQGETTIAVDRHGKALYPALVWLDNRARVEAQRLGELLNSEVYGRTGIPSVNPTWTACKIAWIQEHEPAVFEQAYKFVLAQNFIIHRLTGEFVTDGGVACTTLLLDIKAHRWWHEALDAAGIPLEKLPDLKRVGEVAGLLTHAVAGSLGLKPGIPIVLCGMDQISGAVGAGNLSPEIISESTGGALTIQATVDRPDLDPRHQIPVYLHAIPGKFLFDPVCDTGGMTLKWFRDVFGEMEVERAHLAGEDPYDLLGQLAERSEPACQGLLMLPFLTGASSPEYNPFARGVFYGFTLAHQKHHFARAVLEGVAFMLRRNIEVISAAGIEVDEIRATGGGARSRLWRQIKADVCNLPVVSLRHEDTALLGNAMLGAVATGHFRSLPEAAKAMVTVGERLDPIDTHREPYESAYHRYGQLYDTLAPLYAEHFGETRL